MHHSVQYYIFASQKRFVFVAKKVFWILYNYIARGVEAPK